MRKSKGSICVAFEGPRVIGHVLGAIGHLGDRPVVGIAPLSVTPSRQNEGIGTALMNELLNRADMTGLPLVLLLDSRIMSDSDSNLLDR